MKKSLTILAASVLAVIALTGCTATPAVKENPKPSPSATSTPTPVKTEAPAVAPTTFTFDASATTITTTSGETVECPVDISGNYPSSVDVVYSSANKVSSFSCTYPVSVDDKAELDGIASQVENG